jgi:hypothetical protein
MWFQESVLSGLLDPELMFYSDEAWFTFGYTNNQNNRYLGTEISYAVYELPLHDSKAGGVVCN